MSNFISISPSEIRVRDVNELSVIVKDNGLVELKGSKYRKPKLRQKIQADRAYAGVELINQGQTLVDRVLSQTVKPQSGQSLVITGNLYEFDSFSLINPEAHKTGFDSISIDGQGGGTIIGGDSSLRVVDQINLDLTDPSTQVTVTGNSIGAFHGVLQKSDIVSVPKRRAGVKLRLKSNDYVSEGGFFSDVRKTYLFPGLSSQPHRIPPQRDSYQPKISGYSEHLDTLDSITITFTRDN